MQFTTDPRAAAVRLRDGGLVAVPTETVYGLAARADDPRAVARVYAAKGRPADHPLIVHVADTSALDAWAASIPEYARELAQAFWPGPMTLVVKRSDRAGDFITGGQDSVAVRVSSHSLMDETLRALVNAAAVVPEVQKMLRKQFRRSSGRLPECRSDLSWMKKP